MKEEFLHYIWEYQKWEAGSLKTYEGAELLVLSPGMHNYATGPDFFNAQLMIGDQKWAGNVEVHLNSSDWYAHHHETDANYDNVILHVVWNHDAEIFRKDNTSIPVLELKTVVSRGALVNYQRLMQFQPGKWINCEADFREFEEFYLQSWLERLYVERLEEKAEQIERLVKVSKNNWEEVLFKLLARNFGLNVNGEAFLSVADSLPFSLVRRLSDKQQVLEALFLGQAGLLDKPREVACYIQLREIYEFLLYKHSLQRLGVLPVQFFRLRPDNFPNIRLSQLASLYHKSPGLFREIIQAESKEDLYAILDVSTSEFWESHYTFEKPHSRRRKGLSRNFIDLIIINTLVPLKFCYSRTLGKDINEELLELMGSLRRESNGVIGKFEELRGRPFESAVQSQALLHLKKNYCDKNQCLKCSLGIQLLQRS